MKKYRFPNQISKNPEEAQLGRLMSKYINKGKGISRSSFDPKFVNLLREKFNFKYLNERTEEKKQFLFIWLEEHKENNIYIFPNSHSTDIQERRLRHFIDSHIRKDFAFKQLLKDKYGLYSKIERVSKTEKEWDKYVEEHLYNGEHYKPDCKSSLGRWAHSTIQRNLAFKNKYITIRTLYELELIEKAEKIWSYYQTYHKAPSQKTSDKEIMGLGVFLYQIRTGKVSRLPKELKQRLLSISTGKDRVIKQAEDILSYYHDKGKYPSQRDPNPNISKLGVFLSAVKGGHKKTLPEYWCKQLLNIPDNDDKVIEKANAVLEYYKIHGRVPSTVNSDLKILRLGQFLNSIKTNKSSSVLSKEVLQQLLDLPTKLPGTSKGIKRKASISNSLKVMKKVTDVLEYYNKNGKAPSRTDSDPIIRKQANFLHDVRRNKRLNLSEDLKQQLLSIPWRKRSIDNG